MMSWICPECGGECSPVVQACPVCATETNATAVDRKAREQPSFAVTQGDSTLTVVPPRRERNDDVPHGEVYSDGYFEDELNENDLQDRPSPTYYHGNAVETMSPARRNPATVATHLHLVPQSPPPAAVDHSLLEEAPAEAALPHDTIAESEHPDAAATVLLHEPEPPPPLDEPHAAGLTGLLGETEPPQVIADSEHPVVAEPLPAEATALLHELEPPPPLDEPPAAELTGLLGETEPPQVLADSEHPVAVEPLPGEATAPACELNPPPPLEEPLAAEVTEPPSLQIAESQTSDAVATALLHEPEPPPPLDEPHAAGLTGLFGETEPPKVLADSEHPVVVEPPPGEAAAPACELNPPPPLEEPLATEVTEPPSLQIAESQTSDAVATALLHEPEPPPQLYEPPAAELTAPSGETEPPQVLAEPEPPVAVEPPPAEPVSEWEDPAAEVTALLGKDELEHPVDVEPPPAEASALLHEPGPPHLDEPPAAELMPLSSETEPPRVLAEPEHPVAVESPPAEASALLHEPGPLQLDEPPAAEFTASSGETEPPQVLAEPERPVAVEPPPAEPVSEWEDPAAEVTAPPGKAELAHPVVAEALPANATALPRELEPPPQIMAESEHPVAVEPQPDEPVSDLGHLFHETAGLPPQLIAPTNPFLDPPLTSAHVSPFPSAIGNLAAFADDSKSHVVVAEAEPETHEQGSPLFPGAQRSARPYGPLSWTNANGSGWQQLQINPLVFSHARAIEIPALPARSFMLVSVLPPEPLAPGIVVDVTPSLPAGFPVRPKGPKSILPPWARTVIVVVVASLVIASIVQKMGSSPESTETVTKPTVPPNRSVAAPIPVPPTRAPDPPPATDSDADYPFARFVEVTGLRVLKQGDYSEVQYLVVNHSSTQLTDIGLKVSVRSAASTEGSTPLFTLSARVPVLGPHQSKEIRTTLQLPWNQVADWENLRTEVKVVSEQ